MKLTQALVRELLDYDPETGVLTWRERDRKWFKTDRAWKSWNTRYAWETAGCLTAHGYVSLAVFGKFYMAHRLAYLWMTGAWPEEVDHENHNRADNRWANLRSVTRASNLRNKTRYRVNTSGVTGVYWHSSHKKWQVSISVGGGVLTHVGYFTDKADAIAARKAAENANGFHPNHGQVAA